MSLPKYTAEELVEALREMARELHDGDEIEFPMIETVEWEAADLIEKWQKALRAISAGALNAAELATLALDEQSEAPDMLRAFLTQRRLRPG